jgi:hypothetical protein
MVPISDRLWSARYTQRVRTKLAEARALMREIDEVLR